MKKSLLVVAVLCLATSAFAGPNAGGTLVVHDKALLAANTIGASPICPQGRQLTDCALADVQIDGAIDPANPAFFGVYAAFASTSSPRLIGVTWGIHYSGLSLAAGWNCADGQLPDNDAWPSSDDGDTVWWNSAQTAHLVPIYVFAAYGYGPAASFDLRTDPAQGAGQFGEDSVVGDLDDIAGYSKMGFDGPGFLACPYEPPQPGACCDPATGICTFILQADCTMNRLGGACDPNPCPPPATGSCCIVSDCTVTTQINCTGAWTVGGVCTPNPCPQLGACCSVSVGPPTCVMTLAADCLAPLVWHATGVTCDPNTCPLCCGPHDPGACCSTEAVPTCEMMLIGDCASPRLWHGEIHTCTPNTCPGVVPVERKSWGQIKSLYR